MDELKCPKCGQELRTISVGVFCDNCGPLEFGMDVRAKIEKAEAKVKELEAQLATAEAKVRADIAKALPSEDEIGDIIAGSYDGDEPEKEIIALCVKAVEGK